MEKLLLIGIDTRSMLNSALKLNYTIYSTSYFSTSDTPIIENQKIILKEEDGVSCGVFEDKFNSENILEISRDYLDEVDYIIPISGISPSDFSKGHKKKILGNKNVKDIENKYNFYEKIKDEFLTPMTFNVIDIDEAFEISKNYQNIQFNKGEFILQEYVSGINLSSSVLASKDSAKTIMNSRLLTINDFEKNNSFIYVGNILPLTKKSIMANVKDINKINDKMTNTSQDLAEKFKLIGSNGVDYILNENGLYVIEMNPRLQGTFECVEKSLGINMLNAHIKACFGEIIEIPKAQYYSYKKIICNINCTAPGCCTFDLADNNCIGVNGYSPFYV